MYPGFVVYTSLSKAAEVEAQPTTPFLSNDVATIFLHYKINVMGNEYLVQYFPQKGTDMLPCAIKIVVTKSYCLFFVIHILEKPAAVSM